MSTSTAVALGAGAGQQSELIYHPDVSPTAIAPPKAVEPLSVPLSVPIPVTAISSRPDLTSRNSSTSNSSDHALANGNVKLGSSSSTSATASTSRRMSLFNKASAMSEIRPITPSRKGKEVFEMTAVPVTRSDSRHHYAGGVDKSKEDLAMAKWRKWVVEQPIEVTETSPIRSRRASPAPTMPGHPPPSASSNHRGSTNSPLSAFSPTQLSTPYRTGSGDSALLSSPHALASTLGSPTPEVYNTESVRALRDVELAVDEEILERAERAKGLPRRLSTQPRISELPNPFVDISTRLGSRRVRPITLELIQALGHFIDAVWCTNFPHRSCPWIIGVDESPLPASIRRMNTLHQNAEPGWKSPMITAVQEGKEAGYVPFPPTAKDVRFWLDEVTFALRDVDEVVGIYKGVGWAFGTALRMGIYGDVSTDNVLGVKGEGGGMARLLNDLEEAIWGDAPPRPTDLSYSLPIDFDPYAIPDDSELMVYAAAGTRGRGLSDFFGSTANTSPDRTPPIEEEDMYNNLPDLVDASNSEGNNTDGAASPDPSAGERAKRFGSIPIGIDGISGAEEMTLEELGKRRHQEWLDSQRGNAVW